MREALLIFRKDVYHLWPRTIPVLAVTALLGWTECELFAIAVPAGAIVNPIIGLLRGLWLLSTAYLVASAIHQEPLPGHQQYWLTRPYHWVDLLLAKGLFLTVFTGLPVLAIEAISLLANGVSPWRHVWLLVSAALVFAGGAVLIVGAMAAVTENLVQLLWAFLPAVGVVILGLALANTKDFTGDWYWGRLEWMRSSTLGGAVLAASIAVLLVQYSRRKTAVSRGLLGGAILLAAAGPFLGSWHGAWEIESRLSKRQLDRDAARIAFDPASRPALGFADSAYSPDAGEAGINLPILVTGIPPGTEVVSERIATRIETPDGRSWASAWTPTGGLYRTTPLEDAHVIPADGTYWEYVNVDEEFFRSVKDTTVHMHTSAALTLLGERRSSPLATRSRNEYESDQGMCRAVPGPFAKLLVACAWLGGAPARGYVTAVSAANGQTYASLITTGAGGPPAMTGSIWARDTTLFTPPPATHEMDLETWQAVSRFDRDLDLPKVRLADFAVRRITDMP